MYHLRVVCLLLVCTAGATTACERRDPRQAVDSAADSGRPAPAAARRAADWARELGSMLLVPSDSDNAAVVLYPDEPSQSLITSAPTTLISIAGDTSRMEMSPADSQQCGDAAVVRLTGPTPPDWSVGLLRRSAALLPMDSIEALPPPDSARIAVDLARLASALRTHRDSRFTGLPFTVLAAHRFSTDSVQFLVGHLARRLNQEASPLEERTLLIGERSARLPGASYQVTYSQRSEGTEDTAEHFEALAAARGRRAIFLLVARDQLSRTLYEVLERAAGGRWRMRWSRSLAC